MELSYQIIRSPRKTIAIQITPEGSILVRCPNRMPAEEIRKFVESKSHWIESHLSKRITEPRLPPFTEAELRALAQKAAQIIPERVAYFAPMVGVTWGRITLRRQRTRWGSCSGRGNLNFNCLLVLMPPEVLDYVVVHELCHRKEMNHSPAFWAQVERVLPNYRKQKQWLKENGNAWILRLPK